jgi:hypothetical protein
LGWAATYTVNTTADAGAGSLRQAIIDANTNAGIDTINFNIPIAEATAEAGIKWWKIKPLSALPNINETIIIDGTTQPTSEVNNNPYGPEIEIDGSSAGDSHGLVINNVDDCAIKGLVINRFNGDTKNGIRIDGGDRNSVFGCYLGTDISGEVGAGNYDGIFIFNNAQNNIIGSTEVGGKNIISANYNGVYIWGNNTDSNKIVGNFIGTNASGTKVLGNSLFGVSITNGAKYNWVGNGTADGRNIISGNYNNGINISETGTNSNEIVGNYIGVDASGTSALGNISNGVEIANSAQYNKIGGVVTNEGNIISGNYQPGIYISGANTNYNEVLGNYIGTDINGNVDLGNVGPGVVILSGAQHNKVGNGILGGRNVISGNGDGINIASINTINNEILGNYIGTTASGEAALGNTRYGIEIESGAQCNRIGNGTEGSRNIVSGNGDSGIAIVYANTNSNEVLGNYIGTDKNGSASLGNLGGVEATYGAHNKIGNGTVGGRNLISGNDSYGLFIHLSANSNEVLGNYIGTDKNGLLSLGNDDGILIGDAQYNKIGNGAEGGGNLISGNNFHGVVIYVGNNNEILGNYIGTDRNGTASLGNWEGVGICLEAQYNKIGNGTVEGGNIISGNNGNGIGIFNSNTNSNEVLGNYIGIDKNGIANLGNLMTGVRIYDGASSNKIGPSNIIAFNGNAGIMIDGSTTVHEVLTRNSVFLNYGKGIALVSGGNEGIASPEIISVLRNDATGLSQVTGARAPSNGTVEIFKAEGNQGKTYLCSIDADVLGNWSMVVSGLTLGDAVIATGTTSNPQTSEFSLTKEVVSIYQPDNLIANLESGADYMGEGIYNANGTDQTKTNSISVGESKTYYIKIKNTGKVADQVIVTGTASSGAWEVTYCDAKLSGNNITSQVTGSGWITNLVSNESREMRVIVQNIGTTLSTCEVLITSTSNANNLLKDTVKAKTVAIPFLPPPSTNYFNVNMPSNAIAENSFSATVTARDSAGNPVAAVIGTTSLTVDTGTITPDSIAASAFSSGVWTGNITLGSPGGRTITVTNGTATGSAYVLVTNATREYTSAELGIPGMSITIPAGAATADVTVSASITTVPGAPPAGYSIGGDVFNIVSTPLSTFLLPVTVTIPISGPLVTPKVQYWTGTAWSSDGIVIMSYTSTSLTFTTTHFTIFAPIAALPSNLVRFGPNPYNPNTDTGRFWYWLTTDADTSIYLIDLSGSVVWKQTYNAGINGGKKDENNIVYDGKTSWGDQLGQGVYIYKIVQGGKSIGGGKIAVIK